MPDRSTARRLDRASENRHMPAKSANGFGRSPFVTAPMTTDPHPPPLSLRRQIALATKGMRLAVANGVAHILGLRLQAYEPQRGPPDPSPRPATVPAKASATRFSALRLVTPDDCAICGDPLAELNRGNCPNCGSPARLRTLPPLLDQRIAPAVAAAAALDLPLLGLAMTGVETRLVREVFPLLKSASLYGRYGKDHELGVDVRDLTRYADGAFSAHFSILLFDYFTEHGQAIREAYRVLAPGGIFFTHIAPFRLTEGNDAPFQSKEVRGRPGYFDYLPEDVALSDTRVGRQWFLQAMADAGFRAEWVQANDRATDQDQDWFVGYKPAASESTAAA
jgi:SAM-dependent methyltransferase